MMEHSPTENVGTSQTVSLRLHVRCMTLVPADELTWIAHTAVCELGDGLDYLAGR